MYQKLFESFQTKAETLMGTPQPTEASNRNLQNQLETSRQKIGRKSSNCPGEKHEHHKANEENNQPKAISTPN